MLSTSEMQEALKVYGMNANEMTQALKEFTDSSPIMTALNIMTMNITVGLLLSLPVALITRRSPRQ